MIRFNLEPAYILHTRPYRDTSLIVEFFTKNQGKCAALARSARGLRSRFKGVLVPFTPLLISCYGKSDLLYLTALEANGPAYFFQGKALFNSLYLNELLYKLLPSSDPNPQIFAAYQETLANLYKQLNEQKTLRTFEMRLLTELGYGLHLPEAVQDSRIKVDQYYDYHIELGLIPSLHPNLGKSFKGDHLIAIAENNFENSDVLKTARNLMRLVLGSLLGDYKIQSRELFI